ncbi:MAG: hypothetical protein R3B84_22110 [Zavarzinella sp.]
MELTPNMIGRLCSVVMFGCIPLIFLVLGLRGRTPTPRRLAYLSLFCGLMVFVVPEIVLKPFPEHHSTVLISSGIARVIMSLTGIVLAGIALATRRSSDMRALPPIAGLIFCVLHLFAGAGMTIMGFIGKNLQPENNSASWDYSSPDGKFEVTLPSRKWEVVNFANLNNKAGFLHRGFPNMKAVVQSVIENQTEQDFDRIANSFHDSGNENTIIDAKDGLNAADQRCSSFIGIEQSEGKELFIGYSITWCAERKVVVVILFEGVFQMKSQAGKETERQAMKTAAETILYSVR